jgi:hypothetical protein
MFRSLNRLDPKFLLSRPPDDCFRHFYPLLIRECDNEREGFPRLHGQITGETPAGTGEVPDCAVAMEWASVLRDGAWHREAAVGTKGEGHGGLAA